MFRRITRALPLLAKLSLENVSPRLLVLRDLEVVVPGTYKPLGVCVSIASFSPEVRISVIVWVKLEFFSLTIVRLQFFRCTFLLFPLRAPLLPFYSSKILTSIQLNVITSKQRPRRLSLRGSDGKQYAYLLKGNEDPRMDERAMAFFRLVNQLLETAPQTAEQKLAIIRYSITPLSPRCGLIGWVPDCDTLHALVREYRTEQKVRV